MLKVLFVISGNSIFDITPFIKNQADSLTSIGVQIDYYKIIGKGIKGYLNNIFTLKKYIAKNNFDIIHAHYSLCGWVALLSFSKPPLIVSYMGCDVYGDINQNGKRTGYLNIILSQILQPFVDKIIVKSKNLHKYIFLKNKAYILPNGVNFEKFKPLKQSEVEKRIKPGNKNKTLLFLGSPSDPRKNISLLEKSLKLLNNVSVTLLNPYPIDPNLIVYYLNAADTLVLTSKLEGSPNVIKEAMACSCPIVATDVGDVKEVIGNTDGCYICSFDPEDVAKKIELALKFGKKTDGRENIKHLDERIIANKLIKIYKQVINGGN